MLGASMPTEAAATKAMIVLRNMSVLREMNRSQRRQTHAAADSFGFRRDNRRASIASLNSHLVIRRCRSHDGNNHHTDSLTSVTTRILKWSVKPELPAAATNTLQLAIDGAVFGIDRGIVSGRAIVPPRRAISESRFEIQ
jgi:hypothetical protein